MPQLAATGGCEEGARYDGAVASVGPWRCAVKFKRITVRANQMNGEPCIRGLRIPVATVVGMVATGMKNAEILKDYPDLEPEDIREALQYAAEAVRERDLPLVRER
jgi:uncharacterized protein (DUF433 family)